MTTRDEKYRSFQALRERPGAFVIPNPWDAGSAKILTALGFEALATTSAGFAFAIGRDDSATALTREAILANAKSIVDATSLPVSADLQDGFGREPESCAETIQQAVGIGLVGGSIEDSGNPSELVYDFQLSVERVAAAAEIARNNHFMLTARAENFIRGRPDLDDTIRRLQAFDKAGADVLYAPGLPSLDAIKTVCESVTKPVNVVMGLKGAPHSVEDLAGAGVKRISVGGSFARAALGGFIRAAKEVRDLGSFTYSEDALPHADAVRFMTEGTS